MTALVPLADIREMASVMGKSGIFGKTPEELFSLMLIAQAEGKHPAIAAQEYDIIKGRPAINSKSALARFQMAGGSIKWTERTDKKASAEFSHPQGGTLEITWTMDRAKLAGLAGKENWLKYPAQMLSSRVVAEGVRAIFPACLSGLYTVEEVQDFEPRGKLSEKTLTPESPSRSEYWQSKRLELREIFEKSKVFSVGEISAYRDRYADLSDADGIDAFLVELSAEAEKRMSRRAQQEPAPGEVFDMDKARQ